MYARAMVKQSLPLLIFCGIGGIVAGSTLSSMITLLKSIPGLIIIIPAIIAMRGNISTALGSRLGSAYHLGVIDATNMWNKDLKENIIGSLLLSFIISILIGFLAYIASIIIGVYPDLLKLLLIVIIAGIISSLFLTSLTVGIIYLVFKRGYDPDNITGPALATFGDILTMFSIFISALGVEVIL